MNGKGSDRIQDTSKFPAKIIPTEDGSCSVVWQPGDGTRYVFLFTKIGNLLESEGVAPDSVMGTIMDARCGALSLVHGGGMLSFDYAAEKMQGLRYAGGWSSFLWAFVTVFNWLYGSVEYGDGVYARMSEMYRFENRLALRSIEE